MANISEHHERGIHHKQPERPNPLASGIHCPSCGTWLDKPERVCPLGPHDVPLESEVPC